MPYFIYRVEEPKKLTYIEASDKFKDAKARVRELRTEQDETDDALIRMIFAKTTIEAEKLLSAPRDDRVIGEE